VVSSCVDGRRLMIGLGTVVIGVLAYFSRRVCYQRQCKGLLVN